MLTNGCAGSAALANCSSFAVRVPLHRSLPTVYIEYGDPLQNGLMSNGLHGALLEYQREGMSILSDYLLLYTNTSVEEHVYNVTFGRGCHRWWLSLHAYSFLFSSSVGHFGVPGHDDHFLSVGWVNC